MLITLLTNTVGKQAIIVGRALTVTIIMKTYNKSMFLWNVFMYPSAIIYVCDGMYTSHKFPYTACKMSIKRSRLDSFLEKRDVKAFMSAHL